MRYKYFITTKAAKNPLHDKRTNYGVRSVAEFKEGTKLFATECSMGKISGHEITWVKYEGVNNRKIDLHSISDKEVIAELGLVPYTPTDSERARIELHGFGDGDRYTDQEVIEKLFERGILTFDAVKEVVDEVYSE